MIAVKEKKAPTTNESRLFKQSKDSILNQISEAEIFLKYLKLSEFPKGNISSPFSEDNTPSFKLNKNNTFKCFSTGKQGDCFQLVADLNNLDCKNDFNKILDIISQDCNLISINQKEHFKYTPKPFSKQHLEYWNKNNWNVTEEVLKQYNVQALDEYEFWNSKINDVTKIKLYEGIGFIYSVNSNIELYIPKQPKHSKFFYNHLSSNDVFGLNQITNQCENLIVTAGKKDCLILIANGFNAITFRSENHYITPEQIELLKAKAENIFICYDNDHTGLKSQVKYTEKYNLLSLKLPSEFNDVADYFEVFDKENFNLIVNEAIEAQKNKESYEGNKTIFHTTEEYLSKFYKFRYNQINLDIEYCKKGTFEWQSVNENSLFIELQKKGIKISINNLLAILKSEYVEHYNPLKTYFENLPKWDNETDYILKLCSYVKAKDSAQFEYHFKKWCVRAVKCVLEESYFNKQAFVLVHKGQSSGKSTWCRFLCPPTLKQYIAEDISNDKDARILLCKNFLINLDELAVLSRKEINSLKSYFSKTVINERLPYDRKNSIIPRVCSFIGSTNMINFLNDDTGSVRWLCFELTDKIDFNYSKEVNVNNLWAQAYALALSNFDCELSIDDLKINEDRNSPFKIVSTEQELISKYFYPPKIDDGKFMTATDVLMYLQPYISFRINTIQIGKALSALNYDRVKDRERGNIWGYQLKPLSDI